MKSILCRFVATAVAVIICLGMTVTVYATEKVLNINEKDYVSGSGNSKTENSSISFEGSRVTAETGLEGGTTTNLRLQVTYIYFDEVSGNYLIDADIVKAEGRQGYVKAEFEKENCYVVYVVMETEVSNDDGIKLLDETLSVGNMSYIEMPESGTVTVTPKPSESVDATPTVTVGESTIIRQLGKNSGVTEDEFWCSEVKNGMEIIGYAGDELTVRVPALIDGKKVISIAEDAFGSGVGYVEVILPESIISIGDETFFEVDTLEKINLPDSLKTIGEKAFFGCIGLPEIKIPAGIEFIGSGAFASMNLKSISVDEDNKKYTSDGNCLIEDKVTLIAMAESYVIPDYVKNIADYTFSHDEQLTEFELPDSIECIGTGVFERCMNLKKVVLSAKIKNIGMRAFDNCRNLEEIIFIEGSTIEEIGDGAFAGCRALKSIELPEGLKTIGGAFFYRCESLESIKIPDGVTEIGVMAFSRCTALAKVEIPASVTSIADSAFHECKNVTIYGTEGSAAQEYAVSHGIPFESVE